MNAYNFNHFYYFYITAKLEGVTFAAKYLNTSQSSLSTQIKTLEAAVGKKLFKKAGRRIELTDAGKEIYQYCRRSFEILAEMSDQIEKKPNSMGVRMTIGVSIDIDRPFVTDLIAKIIRSYPKTKTPLLNLISVGTTELFQMLKTRNVDLLLTSKGLIDQDIHLIKEFAMPVGLYGTPEIAKKCGKVSIEEIARNADLGFVLPSKLTGLREEIDAYFIKKKIRPKNVFESNIMASVVRAASDGLGCTIIPEAYIAKELQNHKLISLSHKPLWKYRMMLLSPRNQTEGAKLDLAEKLSSEIEKSIPNH
jgi:LysR family transcriptional regulator, transcriptional activator of nhaA